VWRKINLRDKISFSVDIVKSYFLSGKRGVSNELSDWEESIEISENPQYDKRIKEIQKRMARSV